MGRIWSTLAVRNTQIKRQMIKYILIIFYVLNNIYDTMKWAPPPWVMASALLAYIFPGDINELLCRKGLGGRGDRNGRVLTANTIVFYGCCCLLIIAFHFAPPLSFVENTGLS